MDLCDARSSDWHRVCLCLQNQEVVRGGSGHKWCELEKLLRFLQQAHPPLVSRTYSNLCSHCACVSPASGAEQEVTDTHARSRRCAAANAATTSRQSCLKSSKRNAHDSKVRWTPHRDTSQDTKLVTFPGCYVFLLRAYKFCACVERVLFRTLLLSVSAEFTGECFRCHGDGLVFLKTALKLCQIQGNQSS